MGPSATTTRFWPWVWAIAAIAGAWQLLFIAVFRRDFVVWGDAYFYHEGAKQVADGVGWVDPLTYNTTGVKVQAADHPPLYILFLATLSWIGLDGPVQHMVLTAVCFGVPIVIVTALAGREIGGERLGIFAAATVAVYPGVWTWQGSLLSEPVAMLGCITVVWLSYRFWHRPSLLGAVWLGASLGLATYGRAELILLSVVLIVPLVLQVRTWSGPRRVAAVCLAGATCAGVLAPWVGYNLSRFEQTVLISEGYQITLATASCDEAWYGDGTGYWNLACPGRYLAEAGLTTENSTQPERSHEMLVRSLDYIGDHLDRLPTVLVARWARIVGLWKPVSIARLDAYLYERDPWDTYLQQATWYPAAALAVVGVVVLRRRGTILLPVLAPFLVVFITITVTYAQNRYRAATEPVVALLAAVGVERLWRAWRQLLDDPHAQPEAEDSPALGVAPASSSTNVTAAANNSAAVSDGR